MNQIYHYPLAYSYLASSEKKLYIDKIILKILLTPCFTCITIPTNVAFCITIAQTTQDKDIIFTVNDGGVTKEALRINGAQGRIEHLRVGDLTVDGTNTIINTSTLSVEDNIIELNRNVSSNAGMPNFTGLKVNRGESSSATEQNLYWVWAQSLLQLLRAHIKELPNNG